MSVSTMRFSLTRFLNTRAFDRVRASSTIYLVFLGPLLAFVTYVVLGPFDLHGSQLPPNGVYHRILKEVEFPLITIALDATGGNQAKCANLLGINRNTLRKKISELDIQVTRRRKLM